MSGYDIEVYRYKRAFFEEWRNCVAFGKASSHTVTTNVFIL